MTSYHWHRYSAAESFERIRLGKSLWVAFGDFLDDWHRSQPEDRLVLVQEPPVPVVTLEEQHWATLFAAAVELLSPQEHLSVPNWVMTPHYYLQDPWYPEAKTTNFRRLLEETTPEIFKRHNVFSGDRILERA
jgi:hypothetical protein